VDLLAARLDLMDEAGLPLPDAIHDTWREIQSRGLLAEACRVGLVDRMLAWLPARTNPYLHAEIDEQSRPLRQATAPTLTAGE
jgi:hypothetical protein